MATVTFEHVTKKFGDVIAVDDINLEIADSFSLVDVADTAADRVVAALRGATIRGRTFAVHRDRDG